VPAPIDVYGERPVEAVAVHKHRQRILLPVLLFIATCITTYLVGGPAYAGCVMGILLAHELGHFVQARQYHVPASLPYFIPIPAAPLGTMGAVIVMRGHMGNRKALFDIGITGPLAGLVPALICCVVGLSLSEVVDVTRVPAVSLGSPLLFDYLAYLRFGSLPANQDVLLHPVAFAGWVGLFITALNLMPIGQLDGGHILYALLRRKAHPIATLFLAGALLGVVLTRNVEPGEVVNPGSGVHVAYEDDDAYARWVGKDLPTEAEWEFAARGGLSGKPYAWGDDLKPGGKWMANIYQGQFPVEGRDTAEDGFLGIAPVGQYPPNGYGLYDVAGNVWEWTSDWYRPDTYATIAAAGPVARNPKGPESGFDPAEPEEKKRVHRGGSFLCTDQYCTRYMIGTRGKGEVNTASNHVGFRCVKDPTP
jgi:Zn-dependent protease